MKRNPAITCCLFFPAILATIVFGLTSVCQAQGRGGGKGGGGVAAYTIIPFAPGGVTDEETSVLDLNDVGEAVGKVWTATAPESYHLDLHTVPETYTPIPGDVQAINNFGEMVGYTRDEENQTDLGYYLVGPGSVPVVLPPLTGYTNSKPWSINDAGIIVGESRNTGTFDPFTAVAWRPVINAEGTLVIDGPVPLFPLDGDPGTSAFVVNDPPAGGPFQIVGRSGGGEVGNVVFTAVTWTIDINADGTLAQPSDAVNLGSLVSNGGQTRGNGNNDFGDVCGVSGPFPMVKPMGGVMQPLQLPKNALFGHANDVNELGHIVGDITVPKGKRNNYVIEQHAYLWATFDADPTRLDSLIGGQTGWDSLSGAEKINSNGAIAGYGVHNGVNRGFIMTPNP